MRRKGTPISESGGKIGLRQDRRRGYNPAWARMAHVQKLIWCPNVVESSVRKFIKL